MKVGIFVSGILLLMAFSIFIVGGSTKMLEQRYVLNGAWEDVAGLKEGAVVRLAGWDVGQVSKIEFSDDLGVKEIFVELKIMTSYQVRIRKDSEARIDTVGVLGDKYVSISMGDPAVPQLKDSDWINTQAALDVLEYTKRVEEVLNSTASIGKKVDNLLGSRSETESASLSRSFDHLEELLSAAEKGGGLLHALVYDAGMTTSVTNTLKNLESASLDFRGVTSEIRRGDGLANELIYGNDGAKLASELGQLASAITGITGDLRNSDSLLHSILYDPEKAGLVDDLAATAEALRTTSEAISGGDGTLGLLSRDPALYEDLRALVGGAQRNKLLRAYIRRTVQQGEEANAGSWQPVE
jgi:phospholipid/cholesterol/gamma-HCH transport system substrate-binding protein